MGEALGWGTASATTDAGRPNATADAGPAEESVTAQDPAAGEESAEEEVPTELVTLEPGAAPDDATLFGYEALDAAALRLAGAEEVEGARVTDAVFPSPRGGSDVTAWLVEPLGSGAPYAGLVWLHGSETGRSDLRDEAVAAASGGAVSLVLNAPFRRPQSPAEPPAFDDPEGEAAMTAQAVVEVRAALDVLAALPGVDPARLGVVGHSWGANEALVVAAVEPRVAAAALLAPRPSWTGFLQTSEEPHAPEWRSAYDDAARQAYVTALAPFDALPRVGAVSSTLLLQFGEQDDVVPPDVAQELIDAAPEGTQVQWFDAGHALDAAAVAARLAWLGEVLGLGPVPPDVLATVGLPDE